MSWTCLIIQKYFIDIIFSHIADKHKLVSKNSQQDNALHKTQKSVDDAANHIEGSK